ncbi:FAD-dependent oxidoreductase [Candidatus Pacearchaeota archaeon]|nr:FAD-dependent oxidoreductase [Candidatus Pacearchaeota archaeon]
MKYDLIILGGGPAGLTAAIYAGRYNLKTLIVAESFGGTANLAGEVENWPGKIGSGMEIMSDIKVQAEKFGAEFLETSIDSVKKEGEEFIVSCGEKIFYSKTLIVALGTKHRKLEILGEEEFLGKGVSYCAICDGNFFRNKTVSVIGGADSAAKAALYLANICEKVYVVYRKDKMRCEAISLANIEKNEKIEIIYNATPSEIVGEGVVKQLKISKDNEEKIIDVSGVFVEIGATPSTNTVESLNFELENGYIITGKDTKTNIEGVFAAGDITNIEIQQMITAAGEGAIAAHSVQNFLMNSK